MHTNPHIPLIILIVLAAIAILVGVIWLIIEFAPILLGVFIFLPWLIAALAAGANV